MPELGLRAQGDVKVNSKPSALVKFYSKIKSQISIFSDQNIRQNCSAVRRKIWQAGDDAVGSNDRRNLCLDYG